MKKIQIRQGVFETNSSSTHSLTICSKQEYEDFKNGKLLIDWNNKFVPNTEENAENEDNKDFESYGYDFETFYEEHTTPSGDEIVVFGYYGHD